MFKKITTAGIMCLALANSAAAQGAAGTGLVQLRQLRWCRRRRDWWCGNWCSSIGNWCCCSGGGCGRWGHFRDYRHSQLRPGLSDFNTVESVEIWPQTGLLGFTKVCLVNRR